MGKKTAISWTRHTFNIWWGCVHAAMHPGSDETSPECDNCYAEAFDHRVGGEHWGATAPRRFFGDAYWAKPLTWNAEAECAGVRSSVFCSSMADWAERHPDPAIDAQLQALRIRMWRLIRATPWLDWLLLTKRAERLPELLPWHNLRAVPSPLCRDCADSSVRGICDTDGFPCDPHVPWPNVWVGVTCGARSSLWRIAELRKVRAARRFVSAEPLLDHITAAEWDAAFGVGTCKDCGQVIRQWATPERGELEGLIACGCNDESGSGPSLSTGPCDGIDWLIVGDESAAKSKRRAVSLDAVRTARDAAARHGIAFHFKQWCGPSEPGIAGPRKGLDGKIHLPLLDGARAAARPEPR